MSNPQIISPNAEYGFRSTRPGESRLDSGLAVATDRYGSVRAYSEALSVSLDPEDCVAQSMPDTSPTKWHLAHTTWFFETFVLKEHVPDYTPFHPAFGYLFNSYYNGAGERHARPERGVLSRPTLSEILAYRAHVDAHMLALIRRSRPGANIDMQRVIEIGLHHEQQHQELILTDIKHLFAQNPLLPAYRPALATTTRSADALGWKSLSEGVIRLDTKETTSATTTNDPAIASSSGLAGSPTG